MSKTNTAKKTTRSSAPSVSKTETSLDKNAPLSISLSEDFFAGEDYGFLGYILRGAFLALACVLAFYFRLHAVFVYGRVIHEFDPWFNFRATEYMLEHGVFEFFNWFDTMSWYPIGRNIGSTTFPGLQITSVGIYHFLQLIGFPMSINDICVFVPALFGSITTLLTFALTTEVSGSSNAGVVSALIMSILPAHLMRSVAGGYDNESIALAAMVGTFYLWVRSLRTEGSWVISPLTALCYIYMVAAWGGYTYVVNMLGLHAGTLVLLGRFSKNLHLSYSIWYLIGTAGAIQFPVVGWLPLKSMEQLMPLLVFVGLQVLRVLHFLKEQQNMSDKEFSQFQIKFIGIAGSVLALIFGYLILSDFFGPFSNRIRSLFIAHTRTGNPLVDSVSEHQATSPTYYWQYFFYVCYLGPFGFFLLFQKVTDAKIFGILLSATSYYFSNKMVRLLLILSPAASLTAGMFLWLLIKFSLSQLLNMNSPTAPASDPKTPKRNFGNSTGQIQLPASIRPLLPLISVVLLTGIFVGSFYFYGHCDILAQQMSHPQILLQGRNQQGEPVIIDDFMRSYYWLRENTPADARIMAWWDYGYQINGVANRTTIADGNTWNHEHIALLGKALVSPEKKAWRIARHLADYVLIWTTRFAGMMGDDLAKMPHMGNIAGSVYKDVPRQGYYMDENGKPSELMRRSLLYKLTVHGLMPGAEPLMYYKEVYTSPNKMVRIYQVLNVAPRHPFGSYDPKLELGKFEGQ